MHTVSDDRIPEIECPSCHSARALLPEDGEVVACFTCGHTFDRTQAHVSHIHFSTRPRRAAPEARRRSKYLFRSIVTGCLLGTVYLGYLTYKTDQQAREDEKRFRAASLISPDAPPLADPRIQEFKSLIALIGHVDLNPNGMTLPKMKRLLQSEPYAEAVANRTRYTWLHNAITAEFLAEDNDHTLYSIMLSRAVIPEPYNQVDWESHISLCGFYLNQFPPRRARVLDSPSKDGRILDWGGNWELLFSTREIAPAQRTGEVQTISVYNRNYGVPGTLRFQ